MINQPPNYRRRRLVALGVVVVLVCGFVLGIVATGFWVRDTIRGQDAERAAGAAKTVYPQPSACGPTALQVDAVAPMQSRVGSRLSVSVSLRNTSKDACLLDVGAKNLGLVVSSGDQTLLNSALCPTVPESHKLLVAAGELAKVELQWDGMVGTPQCVPTATTDEGSTEAAAQDQATEQSDQAQAATTPAAEAQASTEPSPAATKPATKTSTKSGSDAHVNAVSVLGRGGYARAGTYTLQVQLDGKNIGTPLPLVIG